MPQTKPSGDPKTLPERVRALPEITDCGKDDCTPVEHWQRLALDYRKAARECLASIPSQEPRGLDEAWKAAEEALPEGWWRQLDQDGQAAHEWRASAGEPHWHKGYQAVEAYGPTPAAALLALAERLRS